MAVFNIYASLPDPTAPNTETETVFGVVVWDLSTFSQGIWTTRERVITMVYKPTGTVSLLEAPGREWSP